MAKPKKKQPDRLDAACKRGIYLSVGLMLVAAFQTAHVPKERPSPAVSGTINSHADDQAALDRVYADIGAERHEPLPATKPVKAKFNPREFAFYAAKQAGIDPHLFWGLILTESGGNPDVKRSKAGAIGLGQLMPSTAKELGVNPYRPEENLLGAAFYLARLIQLADGDVNTAIAAYNAGNGTLTRWWAKGGHFERLPAETQLYVGKVRMNESKSRRAGEVLVAWVGK